MQLQTLEPFAYRFPFASFRTRRAGRVSMSLLICGLLLGCMEFTDELEDKIKEDPQEATPGDEGTSDGEEEGHGDGHTAASGEAVLAADFCVPESEVPMLESSHDFVELDITGIGNDVSDLEAAS